MLLNLSGAHAPVFTRNVVIISDSTGHTGLGEVPGGEPIRQTLEAAAPLLVGRPIGLYRTALREVGEAFAGRDASGRGTQTYDERVTIHAIAALECALLDLMGQFLGVPMAEMLAGGQVRDRVPMLGYLFYVGDRTKTPLSYRGGRGGDWFGVRDRPALDAAAIVAQAEAAEAHYGFRDFKLKGGRTAPGRRSRGDPRAARPLPLSAPDDRSERGVAARNRSEGLQRARGCARLRRGSVRR